MELVFSFVEECCNKYGIDESHGLTHSRNTVKWAEKLLEVETNVTSDEKRMTLWGAALHDMCDSKYTDVQTSCDFIYDWLCKNEWNVEQASALIDIIKTISYTKLKKKLCVNPRDLTSYPNHGIWQRAYHIIRHADLLDAYKVRRSVLYTQHKLLDESDFWRNVKDTFENRILRYVSDGWIFMPLAIEYAEKLDAIARLDLENKTY